MRQVDVRIQLELLDEDGFNADWIEETIQDCLMEADGERIIKFEAGTPMCPINQELVKYDLEGQVIKSVSQRMQEELEPIDHPTEHDESDDIEKQKVTTITPHDDIPDSVKFMDRYQRWRVKE